ncbi:APC family permease [Micromonospora sp. NPDC005806]|uniref:APC family permease n=1 Tax=Micromonospora sp. NPDC005806 TaxID=3364234 RepID=UPI00367E3FAE
MAEILSVRAFLSRARVVRVRDARRVTHTMKRSVSAIPATGGNLSTTHGVALYVGAVLGTGVIALPALAARAAGPASLVAWLGLVVASVPLAVTFAALAARYPDSGGVSTYARRAFGPRAAAAVGWWFFAAVPAGAPAAALFAGGYVEAAFGGGETTVYLTVLGLFIVVAIANYFGVRVSGRMQLILAGVLVTLLVVAAVAALPQADLGNLRPFAPHGWLAVGSAAALLVWSFAGWEAVTYLAAEFRNPPRSLPRATAAAIVIVGGLYLAIAAASILVLGASAGSTDAPLAELLGRSFGEPAKAVAAIVALLLTLGVMNTYYAGAAKLGAALGRDGALPASLALGSRAGEVPRRSLLLTVALGLVGFAIVALTGVGTDSLVLATTGSFVAVYAVGAVAALRLLPRRTAAWWTALAAVGMVLMMLAATGAYLLWPLLVGGSSLAYVRGRRRRMAGGS